MPSNRTKPNGGVILANFMKFEDRAPGAWEHDATFSNAILDLFIPSWQAIGNRDDAYTRLLHPIQIEASTKDLVPFKVRHFFPREICSQVITTVTDAREHGLVEILKPFLKKWKLLVYTSSNRNTLDWIHSSEWQHDLECMHLQL